MFSFPASDRLDAHTLVFSHNADESHCSLTSIPWEVKDPGSEGGTPLEAPALPVIPQVAARGHCASVLVLQTPDSRLQGLPNSPFTI